MEEIYQRIYNQKCFHGIDISRLTNKRLDNIISKCVDVVKDEVVNPGTRNFVPTWISGKEFNLSTRHVGNLSHIEKYIELFITNISHDIELKVRHTLNKGPCYWGHERNTLDNITDTIHIPYIGRFTEAKYYYKTLLHEIAHACCSVDRLRSKMKPTEEEICVELVALILCSFLGLNVWEDCINYIISWSYDYRDSDNTPVGRPEYKTKTEYRRIINTCNKVIRYLYTGNKKHKGSFSIQIQ